MIKLDNMEIKYLGSRTVWLKGKKEVVVINPEENKIPVDCRIVVVTEKNSSYLGQDEKKVVVKGPGEYEIGGVEIKGWPVGKKGVIYRLDLDGLAIGVIGQLEEILDNNLSDKVGGFDILIFDIGCSLIKGKDWRELAKKWGVNYLIPVGGKPDSKVLVTFLDEVDEEGLEPIESLKVDKDNLPDGLEIVLLKVEEK